MPRNRIRLQFDAFQEYAEQLDKLGGDIEAATAEALKQSQKHVAEKLQTAAQESKFPAKGKYSSGDTKSSIIDDAAVTWEGTTASINVGFDFKKSGLTTILLMYGTPRMKPVTGLKSAIYGAKTKKEIKEIQAEVFGEAIRRRMEG